MSESTAPATKIVIVAGQEFSVPAETDNEAIRQQLKQMGFADVANADVKTGTRDGTPTVEFVKRAGTKGLAPAALVAHLARVPAAPVHYGRAAAGRVVAQLLDEALTFEAALALEADAAIGALASTEAPQGGRLCSRLALPAVAAAVATW